MAKRRNRFQCKKRFKCKKIGEYILNPGKSNATVRVLYRGRHGGVFYKTNTDRKKANKMYLARTRKVSKTVNGKRISVAALARKTS